MYNIRGLFSALMSLSVMCIPYFLSCEPAYSVSSYVFDQNFRDRVLPWISNTSEFAEFMDRYNNRSSLTEEEKAEILVKLGIVEYESGWLTKDAKAIVNKYYPNLFNRRGDIINNGMSITTLAYNGREWTKYILAQSTSASLLTPPSGQFSLPSYTIALAEMFALRPVFTTIVVGAGALMTAAAVSRIREQGKANTAANSSVTSTGNGPQCDRDTEVRLGKRMHNICDSAKSCLRSDIISTVNKKISDHYACINARKVVIDVCFGGVADDEHRKPIEDRYTAIKNCQSLYASSPDPRQNYPAGAWEFMGH